MFHFPITPRFHFPHLVLYIIMFSDIKCFIILFQTIYEKAKC